MLDTKTRPHPSVVVLYINAHQMNYLTILFCLSLTYLQESNTI